MIGSHTDVGSGRSAITVTVQDDVGAPVSTTATVLGPPGGPLGPMHHGHDQVVRHLRRLCLSGVDRPPNWAES
jgi:hypothetical protein